MITEILSVLIITANTQNPVVRQINDIRVENNLQPLVEHEKLFKTACDKARDMNKHNYWSHKDREGNFASSIAKKFKYKYEYIGEILAYKYGAKEVVTRWMDSPTHRALILKPYYEDIGICVSGEYTVVHMGRTRK